MSSTAGRAGLRALAAAVLLVLVTGVVPVAAHAELVSSDPASGAQVATPPTTITLTFSEGLDASKSSFRLNHNGQNVGTGTAAANGDTVMTLAGLDLEPGDYVVRWTSAAEDGHLERGVFGFTVLAATPTPEPTPTPAATPEPTPTVGATDDGIESPSPTLAPTAAPTEAVTPSAVPSTSPDAGNAGSSGGDVLLPILVGLVLVAGVGAWVLRRSRSA